MNPDGLFQFAKQIVDKDRQAGNVIHVGMRHDYVAHRAALCFVQRNAEAAGVNRDAVVNQEASQALRRISVPAVIKRAG